MADLMTSKLCTRNSVVFLVAGTCLLTLFHFMGLTTYVSVFRPLLQEIEIDINACKSNFNSTALRHQDICCGIEPLLAVIVVTSAAPNMQPRKVIRYTWGTVGKRLDVVLVFLLGQTKDAAVQKKIEEEDALYGDVVQGQFLDTYYNLTLKSIEMLNWVNTYCPNAQFMLKIDDDVFLHVPNFLSFLQEQNRSDSRAAIHGHLAKNYAPMRDAKSKWFISKQEYGPPVYPDFIHGPSYVYTRAAVPLILDAAAHLTKARAVIHLEDVFLSGICAQKANVSLVDSKVISILSLKDVCTVIHSITIHDISSEQIYFMWWLIHDSHFEKCQKVDLASNSQKQFFNILRGQSYSFSK